MYYSSAFRKHFIGSGSVRTSGATENLAPGQIGLFDASSFDALPVATANAKPYKMFIIAQGSMHSKDTRGGINHGGLQESVKSRPINPKFIDKFWVVEPSRPVNDVWTIGYNGVSTCQPITGECGSKYTIRVDVRGEAALRAYNRHLYRYFTIETPCCDDCDVTCDPAVADPYLMGKALVEKINADPELSKFVKAELILETAISDSNEVTFDKFILPVYDAGSPFDLASIQVAYPSYTITRESRSGILSTYSVIVADGVTPSAYTAGTRKLSADECGVCPAGWVTGSELEVEIRRSVRLDTDNDGNPEVSFEDALTALLASQSTAGSIAKQYKDVLLTNLAAVDADVLTADLTVTSRLISTANGVATIMLNIKLIDATPSASTFTITLSDITGGIAAVVAAVNTAESTLDVDDEYTSGTVSTYCASPAATSISWVADGSVYKTTRTLCVTLPKECGSSTSKLSAVTAYFANDTSIKSGTFTQDSQTDCAEVISLKQYSSNYYEKDCLEKPMPAYPALPSFEGHDFKECACPPVASPYTSGAVGIRLIAAYEDTVFGDASFRPTDYYNQAPLKLSVQKIDDAEYCTDNHTQWSVTHLTYSKRPQGLGETILRDYLLASNYRTEYFEQDNRFREVQGQEHLNVIKRSSYYRTYYILHSIPNSTLRGMNVTNYDEKYLLAFSFEEDVDTSAFENLILSYASLNDVELERL